MIAVALFNARQHRQLLLESGILHVGSIRDESWEVSETSQAFLVVEDPLVPPKQFSLRRDDSSDKAQVELTVYGTSIALSSGRRIHPGQTICLVLPVSFCVGDTQFQVLDSNAKHGLDFGLVSMQSGDGFSRCHQSIQRDSPGPATLAAWFDTLGTLQRFTAGSDELFHLAARAVFNPGGLDGSMILVPFQNGWNVTSSHIPYPDHGIAFREDLVARASSSRSIVYHDADLTDDEVKSEDLHTAVVCPVLDETGAVIAIVYGFRSLHRSNHRRGIRFLEAQFVQVVADTLSAAMIRLKSEAQAARSKVLLEQAFAPGVARQLQFNQQILEARDRVVTVLFADLRGFSAIAEQVGTQGTYELLSDVMDRFSSIIIDLDGVIIDYYGDGVSAFWNAPLDQPEHAVLACQAGLEMLDCLSPLNQSWAARIGCELKVGIGIHTGVARVGNSGSRIRLKYGPRGSTVNLASRLESLTKKTGVPILVSEETANRTAGAFATRRVFRCRLRGSNLRTDVFAIYRKSGETECKSFHAAYDQFLELFESGKLAEALSLLTDLRMDRPDDPLINFLLDEVNQPAKISGAETRIGYPNDLIISNVNIPELWPSEK